VNVAVIVLFEFTFVYEPDQPENVCPALEGAPGGEALAPLDTDSVFNTEPSQLANVTVNVVGVTGSDVVGGGVLGSGSGSG